MPPYYALRLSIETEDTLWGAYYSFRLLNFPVETFSHVIRNDLSEIVMKFEVT